MQQIAPLRARGSYEPARGGAARQGWAVETANVTSNGSGSEYLVSKDCTADLVLVQELHLAGDGARRAEAWYQKAGWKMVINDAERTTGNSDKGTSGGTGLATRSWQGLGLCHGMDTTALCKARVSFGHWAAWLPGGVLVASVYLVAGQATSPESLGLLEVLGSKLAKWNRPFLIGGDFQMEPHQLEATGWPRRLAASVVAPLQAQPTSCTSGRMIDYFVISSDLLPLVGNCYVVQEARTSPHRPVRLELRAAKQLPLIRVLKAPRPFPVQAPVGPRRRVDHWDGVGMVFDGNAEHGMGHLRRCYEVWSVAAEKELCDIHDVDANSAASYVGRGFDPQFCWCRPQAASGAPYAKSSSDARAWRWAAARIKEYKMLADAEPARGTGAYRHLSHLGSLLRRWRPPGTSAGAGSQQELDLHSRLRRWCRELGQHQATAGQHWAQQASLMADKLDQAHWASSTRESRRWAQTACRAGARMAHRWSRDPVGFKPQAGAKSPAEAVDSLLEEWKKVWGEVKPIEAVPDAAVDRWLPPLTAEQVRKASLTFPQNTAFSADHWHPRTFSQLGHEALALLARLMNMMERVGAPPLQLLILVFLAKPDGGVRPIGLLSGLIRVWGRARRMHARKWEVDNERPYFWCGAGKSAADSTHLQTLKAEIARAQGLQSGSTLLDMTKCYEKVRHDILLAACKRAGFPVVLVRLCIAVYSGPRALNLGGVMSAVTVVGTSIVAGCTFATTLLRVALLQCFDIASVMFKDVSFYIYIDDIDIGASGTHLQVIKRLGKATRWLIRYLEGVLMCSVSRQKSVVLATGSWLRKRLELELRGVGVRSVRQAKKLGTDYTLGGGRRVATHRRRQRDLRRKTPRFAFLRKGAGRAKAASVHARGAVPASLFGVSVLGIADEPLKQVRQAAAAVAFQHSKLRSMILSFLVGPKSCVDPAVHAHTQPLGAWARAVWSRQLPLQQMDLAVAWAKSRHDGAQRPWLRVVGPAGATVTSLRRIGWEPLSASVWVDDRGIQVSLLDSSPKTVIKLVHEAVRRWSWRQLAQHHPELAHLEHGAYVEPLRKLLGSGTSGAWGPKERASAEAVITGAAPCQQRLHHIEAADDPQCQLCRQAPGTYWHRHWQCDALRRFRDEYGHWRPLQLLAGRASSPMEMAVVERALVPDPRAWAPPPVRELHWHWHVMSADGRLDSPVYIDASALDPTDPLLSRVGIGVATVGPDGLPTAALHAAMPLALQEPGMGEIYVAASVLKFCTPPVELVSDYAGLVDGFCLGPELTTGGNRKYAEAWSMFWRQVDDVGRDAVRVRKVPAHVSRTMMEQGLADISFRDWAGNQQADLAAKRGASLHPSVESARLRCRAVGEIVTAAGRWFGCLGSYMSELEHSDVAPAGGGRPRPRPRQVPLSVLDRVLVVEPPPIWPVRLLGSSASRPPSSMRAEGPAPRSIGSWGPSQRQLAAPVGPSGGWEPHSSHVHWKLGLSCSFCALCGSYSVSRRTPSLAAQCPRGCRTPAASRQLRLLMQGLHPVTKQHLGNPFAMRR